MKILSICLKNIKSHHDRTLDFVEGINVLSGPNGAGKSTIFEAIGYALFGVNAKDFVGNVDRFVSIGEKKGEIAVEFLTDTGDRYRVFRSVGAGSKWLLAAETGGDFEVEEHAGAQETEARIKELLNLDSGRTLADQFKLVIGPFQNEFLGPFVLRQPTKRQESFDEILGIDGWRKTYKGTTLMLSAAKHKIDLLKLEIDSGLEQLTVLPGKKEELKGAQKEVQTLKKELAGKQKLQQQVMVNLEKLDRREKELNDLRAEIRVVEDRVKSGSEKIENQQKQVVEAEKACLVVEKNRVSKEAFEAAEKQLLKLRQRQQKRREVEKFVTELEKARGVLIEKERHERKETEATGKQLMEEERSVISARKENTVDKRIIAVGARLAELRRKVEEMRSSLGLLEGRRAGLLEGRETLAGGICPFFRENCGNIGERDPKDVFETGLAELDREKAALTGMMKELEKEYGKAEDACRLMEKMKIRMEELGKQQKSLEKRRQKNACRLKDLVLARKQVHEAEEKVVERKKHLMAFEGLDEDIARAESARVTHQAGRDTFLAHLRIGDDLANRREQLKKMLDLMEELQRNLLSGNEKLQRSQKEYKADEHTRLWQQKEGLVASVAALGQKLEQLEREVIRLRSEIDGLELIKKKIEAKTEERKMMVEKKELITFLRDRIFKNVSVQLSERFREEISLRADRIYRNIAETDEELYWGDNYRIILRDMADGKLRERSDEQLSGGQIMSSVIALRLAMLQTIGARIAFFDEPTSNLDAGRRENLAHAFRAIDVGREEVTDHWYDQLFLISHDVAFTEVTDQMIYLE